MEIAVMIWIICGIVCAALASGKGKSGAGWFFIGVLFGPLGVVAAFVTKEDQKRGETQRTPKKYVPPAQRPKPSGNQNQGYYR